MSMFSRTIVLRSLSREYRSKANRNPGVQGRLKLFKNENPEIESLKLNESQLDENESDFFQASDTYDQHERENRKLKKFIEFKRIERKFFSPTKLPNLLTWSEKEQIRYLNSSEPATWTPEKLALSFPATVDIIKKVLKSQWAPKNEERIKNHDKAVSRNWEAIERGELKIPPAYESHIKQFISRRESRNLSYPDKGLSVRKEVLKSHGEPSEFANIIRSYRNQNVTNDSSASSASPIHGSSALTSPQCPSRKDSYYTLEELRRETKACLEDRPEASIIDKHFVESGVKKKTAPIDANLKMGMPTIEKFPGKKSNEVVMDFHEEKEQLVKINIPIDKKKKGSIYKVKDSYYDENGEFLYKVPGMN